MRRTILLPILALVGGLVLGTLLGSGLFSASRRGLNGGGTALAGASSMASQPSAATLDIEDDAHLLARASSTVSLIKEADYVGLSALVHPQKGVTLTPFPRSQQNMTARCPVRRYPRCPRTSRPMSGA